MGKAEAGTPKYIANKMKAKGLQKLRWYCQMCQKQCRDENGFKCHITSESHQRQLLLFADNSRKYMDEFSREFAQGYLELLKRQFGTKRVPANRVYQEYIADRNHLHMNATKWVTLTGFVKWLGREGKCVVDETEKGWFITYIDRDPETIALQEKLQKKEKMEKDDQERMMAFLEKQMKRDKKRIAGLPKESEDVKDNAPINFDDREKVKMNLPTIKPKIVPIPSLAKNLQPSNTEKRKADDDETEKKRYKIDIKPKLSALDEIIATEEKAKERNNRKDNWLTDGIVVKIVTKSLGDDFYKKKGIIREVHDKYSATVSLLDSKHKVRLDQAHLETVIPAVGRLVRVVNGAYRGSKATLLKVDEAKFCVSIEIDSGVLKGRKVNNVQYEDISKLHIE